jgi:membrane protease YdiL (CAAX protease family)
LKVAAISCLALKQRTGEEHRLEVLFTAIAVLVGVPAIWGLVYWTYKARIDRSAIVGLYLLLGIPGTLLLVAGAANVAFGRTIGWALLGFALSCVLPLIKQFRFFLARFTPLDPSSPTDMVGLAFVLVMFTLGIAQFVADPSPTTEEISLGVVVVQGVGEAGIAIAATGIWIYRTPLATAVRLGLGGFVDGSVNIWRALKSPWTFFDRLEIFWPALRTMLVAFGFFVLGLVTSATASLITRLVQPDDFDAYQRVIEQTAPGSHGFLAALLFGLSAGIGEELVFRGLIQIRFGIVLTALLFMATHVQYGITFINLGIFAIGLLLGLERKRYGLSACILTHAMVDTLAVLAS